MKKLLLAVIISVVSGCAAIERNPLDYPDNEVIDELCAYFVKRRFGADRTAIVKGQLCALNLQAKQY